MPVALVQVMLPKPEGLVTVKLVKVPVEAKKLVVVILPAIKLLVFKLLIVELEMVVVARVVLPLNVLVAVKVFEFAKYAKEEVLFN